VDLISVPAALFVVAAVVAVALPLPALARRTLLLAANAAFLWFFDPLAPALFLATSLLAYGAARVAARGVSKPVLALLCAPLLVPLFLPKLPFFTGAAGAAAGAAGAAAAGAATGAASTGNVVGMRLAFFIGASYYTLRALHCILDAHRSRKLHLPLFDFLVYNSFFPTIVAGPIERADHFEQSYPSLGRPSGRDVWEGVVRLFLGLLKKVVIGGVLLQWALPITAFASGEAGKLEWWEAWRALYAIALYAYADFAGYSDLAIGVARLMGVRLAENFDKPYLRPSIAEFWKGWHISLSFWIRDYLFVPMCGRSASKLRPHLAALGSMTLCGLWHAPNLGWGLWGLAHGAGLSVHQGWTLWLRKRFKLKKRLAQSPAFRVFGVLLTFHFVVLTWTLVSLDPTRLGPTLAYLQILFGFA
jgi:alginate O-acetyltransferase complex protein AlgI